jgi:tetratricopeptide (TPR) repeat protein
VLAALDLAEATPVWGTVIDRLKSATVSSHEVVRARAALVYALVRAGRGSEAESELLKIRGVEPPHPLLDELEAFVKRLGAAADAGADAAMAAPAALDPSKLPSLETEPGAASAGAEPLTGDFRVRLTRAAAALGTGDLGRAEELYESVLKEQPQNTEALSGLADVARRKNDPSKASALYDRVLEQNPSYLPALMASADQRYQSGDRKGAVTLYRRILEQAGAGSEYGQRAAARIAEAESSAEAAPAASETPPPSAQDLK